MSDYRDIDLVVDGNALPLDISMESNEYLLELGIEEGSGGKLPVYPGPYEVDPTTEQQVLSTKNKSTTRDIVVNPAQTVNVIDNLDSDSSVDALAARQGKVLKNMIPEDEEIHYSEIDAMFRAVFGDI